MIKVQATLKDVTLVQKVRKYKQETEKKMRMDLSWSQFWKLVIRDWVEQRDKDENFMAPIED